MVKLKIEIDLDDLGDMSTDPIPVDEVEPRFLPTVDASYNNEWMNNEKVWYKTYTKGQYRWVRIEGRGEEPSKCKDIIIRLSPGNTDKLRDEERGYDLEHGDVIYDEHPDNLYIQSERLSQLKLLGYEENENNLPKLII